MELAYLEVVSAFVALASLVTWFLAQPGSKWLAIILITVLLR